MRIALVTTTINVPHVLALYRRHAGPDVRFFIAGDNKSPHEKIAALCESMGNAEYSSPLVQEHFGYACSELISWNCIQRRNIATLEALKWGADLIVSVDDDNNPLNHIYFIDFRDVCRGNYFSGYGGGFECPKYFHGLRAQSPSGWFDVGALLVPRSPHRGFPHTLSAEPWFEPVVDVKVGVAAGICLGDPDISAVTRIANAPTVHSVSELLHAGIVVDPRTTWTVFNSQNSAVIREIAPAFFMLPGVGRYDDIFASLICQRVMREKGMHVHFGKPFVWQSRNEHNLIHDLTNEMFGMDRVVEFAEWLGDCSVPVGGSTVDMVGNIFSLMHRLTWMPRQTIKAGLAWCEDIEKVMDVRDAQVR